MATEKWNAWEREREKERGRERNCGQTKCSENACEIERNETKVLYQKKRERKRARGHKARKNWVQNDEREGGKGKRF